MWKGWAEPPSASKPNHSRSLRIMTPFALAEHTQNGPHHVGALKSPMSATNREQTATADNSTQSIANTALRWVSRDRTRFRRSPLSATRNLLKAFCTDLCFSKNCNLCGCTLDALKLLNLRSLQSSFLAIRKETHSQLAPTCPRVPAD